MAGIVRTVAQYRTLITYFAPMYQTVTTKAERIAITCTVVKTIRLQYAGRFLERRWNPHDAKREDWSEMSEDNALKTTYDALRTSVSSSSS